MEKALS